MHGPAAEAAASAHAVLQISHHLVVHEVAAVALVRVGGVHPGVIHPAIEDEVVELVVTLVAEDAVAHVVQALEPEGELVALPTELARAAEDVDVAVRLESLREIRRGGAAVGIDEFERRRAVDAFVQDAGRRRVNAAVAGDDARAEELLPRRDDRHGGDVLQIAFHELIIRHRIASDPRIHPPEGEPRERGDIGKVAARSAPRRGVGGNEVHRGRRRILRHHIGGEEVALRVHIGRREAGLDGARADERGGGDIHRAARWRERVHGRNLCAVRRGGRAAIHRIDDGRAGRRAGDRDGERRGVNAAIHAESGVAREPRDDARGVVCSARCRRRHVSRSGRAGVVRRAVGDRAVLRGILHERRPDLADDDIAPGGRSAEQQPPGAGECEVRVRLHAVHTPVFPRGIHDRVATRRDAEARQHIPRRQR